MGHRSGGSVIEIEWGGVVVLTYGGWDTRLGLWEIGMMLGIVFGIGMCVGACWTVTAVVVWSFAAAFSRGINSI